MVVRDRIRLIDLSFFYFRIYDEIEERKIMLLDYERYQRKTSKKKKRIILLVFFLAALVGGYFLVTRVFLKRDPFAPLAYAAPKADMDSMWAELVRRQGTGTQPDKGDESYKRLLDDIVRLSGTKMDANPLALRPLVYHGYASFYRALQENDFESQLPFLNQAIVSLRRAKLVATRSVLPQLCYMLGRTYFFKREYYYDLAARYLEQALNLGYKKADVFEYLVLINSEWGNTEKTIGYLERALEEKRSDLYLFHLAKNYYKVKRGAEAAGILEKIIASSKDRELLKECKFLSGEILFDQGKYTQAEKEYRDILKDDPESAEAHFRLALIYEKSGDYAQYRYELRQTLEKDRGHSGARSRLK
jgi:tetratricopeptide (TPR) repeat protein